MPRCETNKRCVRKCECLKVLKFYSLFCLSVIDFLFFNYTENRSILQVQRPNLYFK